MKRRVLMLCFILAMIFTIPIFGAPEDEKVSEETIVIPDNISNAEAYINLKNFQNKVNNKGVDKSQQNIIRVVKVAPKTEISEGVEGTEGVVGTETSESAEEILHFGLFDGQTYFSVEDPEFEIWRDEILETVREDALEGLKVLKDVSVPLDHIKLNNWGEFLSNYYGRNENGRDDFPMGNVVIEYGDYSFTFANSKECEEFILKFLTNQMVEVIKNEAKAYPAKRYVLDIQSGSLLSEYECDLTSVREYKTVYPFDGVEKYIFSNTADSYGVSLGVEYVDILRGYIENGSKGGYDRRVEGNVPGCVNVLAHITLLRNVSGGTLSDKVLSDFTMYRNLAVCLDTKELIDVTYMGTVVKKLHYDDYKLVEDNLLLTPISDSVVLIQPTYLECFGYNTPYGLYERNFARFLDVTEFVSNGSPYFTTEVVVETEEGSVKQIQQIPIERFMDEFGVLDTRLGNSPFLLYYTNYVPYDLLINWFYNNNVNGYGYIADDDERDAFIGQIRDEMTAQNRKDEFDSYVKAAGEMTDGTKTIIKVVIGVVALLLVVVGVIVVRIMIKKSKENEINYNSNVLFGDNDYDDDFDDSEDGGFELK